MLDPSYDKLTGYYFITDHLGSVRITCNSTSGEVEQNIEYLPSGSILKCTESNTVLQPNRFCGKEELTMHGYDMYDSKSRFLTSKCLRFTSLDPLAEKYYSISPYAYAANNPVRFIDPDGRDYILSIDQENSTVTVQATYYASTQDLASAKQAVGYWNNQSNNFTYETKEGNYKVQFLLTVVEVETNNSMSAGQIRGEINKAFSDDKSGGANVYSVVPDTKLNANKNGTTGSGNFVQVKDSRKTTDTGAYEVGHTLGLTHVSNGLMTPSSTDPNRNGTLDNSGLKDMFSYPLRSRVNLEGGNKAGKGTVQYFSPFRDYDPQYPPLSPKSKVTRY